MASPDRDRHYGGGGWDVDWGAFCMNYPKPESYSDIDWQLVQGYMAGRASASLELPECHASKSPAYKHGWLNGLDDRTGAPREKASVLIARAHMIGVTT